MPIIPQPCLSFDQPEKRCTKCGALKPLSEFGKQSSLPGGLKHYCRACCKAIQAESRRADPKRWKAYDRQGYARHAEACKARALRAYYRDPARWKAQVIAWQARNPAKKKAYSAKWTRANLKVCREYTRKRYALRKGAATVPFTVGQLNAKRAYWGDRCWLCGGEPDSWDHVKPLAAGGAHILANLRPICRPCNSSKNDTWPLGRL